VGTEAHPVGRRESKGGRQGPRESKHPKQDRFHSGFPGWPNAEASCPQNYKQHSCGLGKNHPRPTVLPGAPRSRIDLEVKVNTLSSARRWLERRNQLCSAASAHSPAFFPIKIRLECGPDCPWGVSTYRAVIGFIDLLEPTRHTSLWGIGRSQAKVPYGHQEDRTLRHPLAKLR